MLFIVIEQSFLTSRRKAVGVSGNIHLDVHGDRIADYALLDMVDEQRGDFEVVMEYYSSKNKQRVVRSVNWPGGERPVDRPFCGFDNSDPACKKIELPVLEIAITTVCGLTVICAVLGIFIYRKLKYEAALANMSWRISWEEVSFPSKNISNRQSVSRLTIRNGFTYNKVAASEDYGKTGIYKSGYHTSPYCIDLVRESIIESCKSHFYMRPPHTVGGSIYINFSHRIPTSTLYTSGFRSERRSTLGFLNKVRSREGSLNLRSEMKGGMWKLLMKFALLVLTAYQLKTLVLKLLHSHKQVRCSLCEGNMVAIKLIDRHKKVELSRTLLLQLKQMRDVQHENIARFIGVCIDVPHVSILTEYCPKGSLMASFKAYSSICNTPFVDVLQNDSLKLDWMFKYSLINDIVKELEYNRRHRVSTLPPFKSQFPSRSKNGAWKKNLQLHFSMALTYLHSSEVGCHGRLTSRNCFVDSLFVLKVTDFGLPMLRAESTSYSITSMNSDQLLWCAPELLKQDYNPKQITKKGDVYSFSIILQEIILRDNPYCMFSHRFSNTEIIERVKKQENPRFRPQVEDWTCMTELYNLMVRCWTEEPDQRPDFYQISDMMKGINRASDGSGNIMDDLLRRMEQYANNLEALVEQRTKAFLEEKKKSEELLYCVLPKSVAEQLKTGMSVVPETFDSVTIFFSDIVGFTSMCTQSTPRQVVDFLNDLYTCFDHIINDFNVYKVETIGDAYMVVSGLPERNGNIHAKEIARMALSLLKSVQNFCIRHQQNSKLNLRIGIHTGSCCAGVVGKTMPRYCLFGDTVNTASRMEATGLPHHIHVSSDTKTVLDSFGTFIINPRGEIEVKGKGKMFTYWLVDEHKEMDNLTPKG
ncbi:Atrial natriuretic peptide receptor 2 [Nymphon striatum]|nr:Atrial natriuretic peptide receptor 2 [Nymphon striatum]